MGYGLSGDHINTRPAGMVWIEASRVPLNTKAMVLKWKGPNPFLKLRYVRWVLCVMFCHAAVLIFFALWMKHHVLEYKGISDVVMV